MLALGRYCTMCDQATGQGELNKRKEMVKQNEITWFDKMAVAGLGPRAVLAACCWVAVLALSHLHMLMLMIGTGRSGRAAEQEQSRGRKKQAGAPGPARAWPFLASESWRF